MEHEKYEGQDDGEYHFSDDQLNYEAEPAHASPASGGSTASAAVAQYKKPAIGLAIFFVLIFLVYKILAPSSASAPTTNLTAAGTPAPAQRVTNGAEKPKVVSAQAAALAPNVSAPVTTPMQSSAPAMTVPDNMPMPSASMPAVAPAPAVVIQQASPVPMPAVGSNAARLASLEDQSTKMQTAYTQKLADLEAQSSAVQGKLQDLTMRLASIETTLTQLAQGLQDTKGNRSAGMAPFGAAPMPAMPAKVMPPKMIYVVQAIIPGRAWLKSESGDTVTVAEGDVLKDFGRVMKIDPYDGIVEVDIGGKMVSLSYGSGGD
jgi:hypothetical protein